MFYDKGLKFECQMCRYCCSSEPGYVYLTKDEIEKAASLLSVSFDEFISRYCRLVDFGSYSLVSLQETPDYDCIFLSPHGCTIYNARPLQCRTYPFWKNVMESEERGLMKEKVALVSVKVSLFQRKKSREDSKQGKNRRISLSKNDDMHFFCYIYTGVLSCLYILITPSMQ